MRAVIYKHHEFRLDMSPFRIHIEVVAKTSICFQAIYSSSVPTACSSFRLVTVLACLYMPLLHFYFHDIVWFRLWIKLKGNACNSYVICLTHVFIEQRACCLFIAEDRNIFVGIHMQNAAMRIHINIIYVFIIYSIIIISVIIILNICFTLYL